MLLSEQGEYIYFTRYLSTVAMKQEREINEI